MTSPSPRPVFTENGRKTDSTFSIPQKDCSPAASKNRNENKNEKTKPKLSLHRRQAETRLAQAVHQAIHGDADVAILCRNLVRRVALLQFFHQLLQRLHHLPTTHNHGNPAVRKPLPSGFKTAAKCRVSAFCCQRRPTFFRKPPLQAGRKPNAIQCVVNKFRTLFTTTYTFFLRAPTFTGLACTSGNGTDGLRLRSASSSPRS